MFQATGLILVVALVVVLVLAAVGPCIVQNGVNDAVGNGRTAGGNIQESFRKLGDKIENSEAAMILNELGGSE